MFLLTFLHVLSSIAKLLQVSLNWVSQGKLHLHGCLCCRYEVNRLELMLSMGSFAAALGAMIAGGCVLAGTSVHCTPAGVQGWLGQRPSCFHCSDMCGILVAPCLLVGPACLISYEPPVVCACFCLLYEKGECQHVSSCRSAPPCPHQASLA